MAEGWSEASANAALDAELTARNWVQLHTAAPGAAGTAAVAQETDRMQATFGAASAGAATTTGQLQWVSVAGSEDYTHFTTWSLSSAGTFGISGTVTANPVTAGDTFTIATGDLDVTLTLAS